MGTGSDKTKARARAFMIGSHLHGLHRRPDFTEPFLLETKISKVNALREPVPLVLVRLLDHSGRAPNIL